MTPKPYERKAQYHETDQMGIIHHANYIRWFEEARVDFMEQMGFSYRRMEEEGIASPVLGAACDYKSMVRFGDIVLVHAVITRLTGAKMHVAYRVEDAATGALRATGETRHGFTDRQGRPVSLKRANPALFELFRRAMNDNPGGGPCE